MLRGVGRLAAVGALGTMVLGAACARPTPAPPHRAEGLALESVSVWHHQDTRLAARAAADAVTLDPALTQATLTDVRLVLPESDLVATAPNAQVDLAARRLGGRGGIRLESGAAVLTGPEFTLDLDSGRLEITGGAHAQGAIAP